jgi:excisionase family DNA binding protein
VARHYQALLFEAEVIGTGDGTATVRARRPVLEGGIGEARRVLGGRGVVSRETVYRLIREGRIRGWKPRGGGMRRDGRLSNAKWVVDLGSCYELRAAGWTAAGGMRS